MLRLMSVMVTTFTFVLASCATTAPARGASTTSVTLTTDRVRYAPGDTVRVTLRNGSSASVGYNLCAHALQMRADDAWKDVETFPPPPGICPMILVLLTPGSSAETLTPLSPSATPGPYRLTYRGAPADARTTNEFDVEPR